MQVDKILGHGQAEPASALLVGLEGLEEVGLHVLCDPRTIVMNADAHDRVSKTFRGDDHFGLLLQSRYGIDGIADEVVQDLCHLAGVNAHLGFSLSFDDQSSPVLTRIGFQVGLGLF